MSDEKEENKIQDENPAQVRNTSSIEEGQNIVLMKKR